MTRPRPERRPASGRTRREVTPPLSAAQPPGPPRPALTFRAAPTSHGPGSAPIFPYPLVEVLEDGVGALIEGALEQHGAQHDGEGESGGAAEERAVRLPEQRHLGSAYCACAAPRGPPGAVGARRGGCWEL